MSAEIDAIAERARSLIGEPRPTLIVTRDGTTMRGFVHEVVGAYVDVIVGARGSGRATRIALSEITSLRSLP